MKFKLSILFFLITLSTFAQKEDYNWSLTNNILLNFNSEPPIVTTDINFVKLGMSTVSDKYGNLLFYGDCDNVYDKNNNIIYSLPNGLIGRTRSIIVPKPNSNSVFFMFIHVSTGIGFPFEIIQIEINIDSQGVASVGNSSVLASSMTIHIPFIQAAKHKNNIDYWLLISGEQPNQINSYLITQNNILLHNTSTFAENIDLHERFNLKISPDGQKVVYVSGNKLSVLDLDVNTGIVSNKKSIELDVSFLCFEFSPSGEKIFIAANKPSVTLKQYSFNKIENQAAFLSTGQTLPNTSSRITDLQLAPDNKIYVCLFGRDSLGVIENTENVPPVCSFKTDGVYLQGQTAGWHFPHFLRYHANFSYTSNCLATVFSYHGFIHQSILWNFGDSQTSTELEPTHTYANVGTYTVTLTVTYNDNSTETIKRIEIFDKPLIPIIEHE